MDEASAILSFDYAMDDELKDEGHEEETVTSNKIANAKKDALDSKKTKSKSDQLENGDGVKANSKNASVKKPTSKSNGKPAPVPSTNNKKEPAKSKSSTTSSAPTDVKASKDNQAKVEGKYTMSKYNLFGVSTNERFNVSKEKTPEQKLYVSGISEETKASDLQDLFTKHAKIIDAKIIRFSKIPNKCFGLVTFENDSQLEKCVQALNKASLKGCAIALSQNSPLKTFNKNSTSSVNKSEETKPAKKNDEPTEKSKEDVKPIIKETTKEKEKTNKDKEKANKDKEKTNKDKEKNNKDKPASKESSKTTETTKSSVKETTTKASTKVSSAKKEVKKVDKKIEKPPSKDKPKAKDSKVLSKEKEKDRSKDKPKERERDRRRSRERSASSPRDRRRSPHRKPVISLSSQSIQRSINQSRLARMQEIRQREELEHIKAERIRFQKEKERLQHERLKLEREKLEFLRLEREKILKEREEVARRRQLVEDNTRHKRPEFVATKRPFTNRDDAVIGGSALRLSAANHSKLSRSPDHFHASSRRDESGSKSYIESSRFDSRDSRNNSSHKRGKYDTSVDYDNRRHSNNSDRDDRKEFRRENREHRFEESRREHRYNEKDNNNNANGFGMEPSARVFSSSTEPRSTNWTSPAPANQWTSSSERWSSNFDSSHPQSAISPPILAPSLSSITDQLHYSSSYGSLPLAGLSAPYNIHQNRRF